MKQFIITPFIEPLLLCVGSQAVVVLFPYHILITTVGQSGNETEIYSSSILPVFQEEWRERYRTLPIQKLLPENLVAKERTRSEQQVYR